jgi:peroxiredoxin
MPTERRWFSARRVVEILMFLVAGGLIYSYYAEERSGPRVGTGAPDFEAARLDGPKLHMADLRGQIVLLDFWATWCPPCQKSLPALQKLHERYRDTDVRVITVNQDHADDREALVRNFMTRRKYDFPVLLDEGDVAGAYNVQSLPTTVIVGPDGQVRKVEIGIHGQTADQIAAHLGELIESLRPTKS